MLGEYMEEPASNPVASCRARDDDGLQGENFLASEY